MKIKTKQIKMEFFPDLRSGYSDGTGNGKGVQISGNYAGHSYGFGSGTRSIDGKGKLITPCDK